MAGNCRRNGDYEMAHELGVHESEEALTAKLRMFVRQEPIPKESSLTKKEGKKGG
jgi:hypothetical protein